MPPKQDVSKLRLRKTPMCGSWRKKQVLPIFHASGLAGGAADLEMQLSTIWLLSIQGWIKVSIMPDLERKGAPSAEGGLELSTTGGLRKAYSKQKHRHRQQGITPQERSMARQLC